MLFYSYCRSYCFLQHNHFFDIVHIAYTSWVSDRPQWSRHHVMIAIVNVCQHFNLQIYLLQFVVGSMTCISTFKKTSLVELMKGFGLFQNNWPCYFYFPTSFIYTLVWHTLILLVSIDLDILSYLWFGYTLIPPPVNDIARIYIIHITRINRYGQVT